MILTTLSSFGSKNYTFGVILIVTCNHYVLVKPSCSCLVQFLFIASICRSRRNSREKRRCIWTPTPTRRRINRIDGD